MTSELRGRTLCAKTVGDLLLVVHANASPDAGEWRRFCEIAGELRNARGELRALVVTEGGAPNATQRTLYNEQVGAKNVRVAVLTDSAAARAVLTAMSWFNREMRAFAKGDLAGSLAFLRVQEPRELGATLAELRRELGLERRPTGADA